MLQTPRLPLGTRLCQRLLPRVRPGLLKVDIEGYEYEAILGSQEVFRSGKIRAIALELHPGAIRKRGLDPEAIPTFLECCGYKRNVDFLNLVYCL
jgi:hypothetical protein